MQKHEKYLKVKFPDGEPAPLIPVSNLLCVIWDDSGAPPLWNIRLFYKCSEPGKKSQCTISTFDPPIPPGSLYTPYEDMKIIIPKAIKEILSGSENVLEVDVRCIPSLTWNY